MHIARVAEGSRGGRHDSRYLSCQDMAIGSCSGYSQAGSSVGTRVLAHEVCRQRFWRVHHCPTRPLRFSRLSVSVAWRLTTESAFCVNRLIASRLLYGLTTTSADCVSGKTEYVWISFLGNRSFIRSRIKLPNPEPVPPAIECRNINPYQK